VSSKKSRGALPNNMLSRLRPDRLKDGIRAIHQLTSTVLRQSSSIPSARPPRWVVWQQRGRGLHALHVECEAGCVKGGPNRGTNQKWAFSTLRSCVPLSRFLKEGGTAQQQHVSDISVQQEVTAEEEKLLDALGEKEHTREKEEVLLDVEPLSDELSSNTRGILAGRGALYTVKKAIRFAFLTVVWVPCGVTFGIALVLHKFWDISGALEMWWKYALWTTQLAGPTFIKMGQWAATRRDIFPDSFCNHFSQLHSRTQPHSFKETQYMVDKSMKELGGEHHILVKECCLGSGAIAQVHTASIPTLKWKDGKREKQAFVVKALHPGVREQIAMDLEIMFDTCCLLSRTFDAFAWLALPEAVVTFSRMMVKQLNLRHEMHNLQTLKSNFAGFHSVVVPDVVPELCTDDVLVMTMEEGELLSDYLARTTLERKALQSRVETGDADAIDQLEDMKREMKRVGTLGLFSFLKMLLHDNFIHADLHPGNILVRKPSLEEQEEEVRGRSFWTRTGEEKKPKIVLLDAGLVTTLEEEDRYNFMLLFRAIALGKGRDAARLILERSRYSECDDLPAFQDALQGIVEGLRGKSYRLAEVQVGEVMSDILFLSARHKVKLETNFSNLVVSLLILDGVGRQLDPVRATPPSPFLSIHLPLQLVSSK